MSERIRIGIVGAGENTRVMHIPGLRAIDGVELVGVANRSRESSERVAGAFGIPRVFERWEDVVGDPGVDAVVIGTWPNMHAAVTIAALEAGKHVMCEARMARNAGEARAMLAAARARPALVGQVVPAPFTLHADATIRRLLEEGYLGDVVVVDGRDGNAFLDREAPLAWRQDADISGRNVLYLGIWYESLMRWVGEATRVLARGRVFVPDRRDAEGRRHAVRVPEHLDVVGDMACGAQLHLQLSAVTGLAGPGFVTLYGSDGTLRVTETDLQGGRRGDPGLAEIAVPA